MPQPGIPSQRYGVDTFQHWEQQRARTRPYFDHVYAAVSEMLPQSGVILDLAGGDGHTHDVMGPAVADRLVTLDQDRSALRRLRQRYPDTEVVHGKAEAMPFEDESFETIVSITGFDGIRDTTKIVPEIERILKPGGKIIFFRDQPYNLADIALSQLEGIPEDERHRVLVLPVINAHSGAADRFALLPMDLLPLLARPETSTIDKMALEAVMDDFKGNWYRNIYENSMDIAVRARKFTRLVAAINQRAVNKEEEITLTPSLAAWFFKLQLNRFNESNLEATADEILVDSQTTEPLTHDGRDIKRMYVDEMGLPHVATSSKPQANTRLEGKTFVYTARKPD